MDGIGTGTGMPPNTNLDPEKTAQKEVQVRRTSEQTSEKLSASLDEMQNQMPNPFMAQLALPGGTILDVKQAEEEVL